MNSLHAEPCKPQMKIDRFVYAMKHSFASPTMDLEKDRKSTKQLQGSIESTKQSKRAAQEPNNRTKGSTSNSKTDSAYSYGVKDVCVGLNLCSKTVSLADVVFAYSCTATGFILDYIDILLDLHIMQLYTIIHLILLT